MGYWLRYVSNHVSHALSLKVAARGVTVAEWVVLRELYDAADQAPSALAERLGMTWGAISKSIDRLAAKSLVARKTGGDDRRYQTLTLTAKGRGLVPELSALVDKNDDEPFGHLSAVDRKRIEAMLKEIVQRRGLRTVPVA